MNFIEELFYGNINPHTECGLETARHEQATDIVFKLTTKLKDSLSESKQTILERFIEAENEITEETGLSYFKIGFALGVQMMIDCATININKNV